MIILLLITAAIILYLLFWPVPIRPVKWSPPKAPALEGPYARNNRLASLQILPTGGHAPEDVVFDREGRLYTGLDDGRIIRMRPDGSGRETFASTGGRPLGLCFDKGGRLLVADTERGLLAVDEDGTVNVLAGSFEGRPLVFTNNVAAAADGTIYFSESSDRFKLHAFTSEILEGRANGRLLAHDPASGETRLVLDDLYFANGVAVSADQSFVAVAETSRFRIRRVWLSGERAGQDEIWVDNLPGFPDNLRAGDDGLIWAPMAAPRNPAVELTAGLPQARKIVQRLPEVVRPKPGAYTIVLAFDAEGRVVHNLQGTGETFSRPTGAAVHEGFLYLGTLFADDVARVALNGSSGA